MKRSPEEIMVYCHSGALESVTAEQLQQVVELYENVEPCCNESQYDLGWEDGYLHAIGEMKGKLDAMRGDV